MEFEIEEKEGFGELKMRFGIRSAAVLVGKITDFIISLSCGFGSEVRGLGGQALNCLAGFSCVQEVSVINGSPHLHFVGGTEKDEDILEMVF
nr:hypothetical protein [Tanacetum cinerariifolium]